MILDDKESGLLAPGDWCAMSDPRMNSVHLEPPRRADYRRAREELLQARGSYTIAVEIADHISCCDSPHTVIQKTCNPPPKELDCWLVDRDYIYPLKVGINTVGRSPDNDVVVQDAFVSRRHCAILVHSAGHCEVHDTASKNGTFVNGRKIGGSHRLQAGDEIRMCDQKLTFVFRGQKIEKDSPTHTLAENDAPRLPVQPHTLS